MRDQRLGPPSPPGRRPRPSLLLHRCQRAEVDPSSRADGVVRRPEPAGRVPAELARRRHLRDGALLALRSELLGNRREGGADPNRPAVFSRYLKLVTRPLAMSTEVAHVGEHVVDRGAHRDALLPPFHSTLPLLVFTSARSSHQVLAP